MRADGKKSGRGRRGTRLRPLVTRKRLTGVGTPLFFLLMIGTVLLAYQPPESSGDLLLAFAEQIFPYALMFVGLIVTNMRNRAEDERVHIQERELIAEELRALRRRVRLLMKRFALVEQERDALEARLQKKEAELAAAKADIQSRINAAVAEAIEPYKRQIEDLNREVEELRTVLQMREQELANIRVELESYRGGA